MSILINCNLTRNSLQKVVLVFHSLMNVFNKNSLCLNFKLTQFPIPCYSLSKDIYAAHLADF